MDKKLTGTRIKEAREAKELTQTELGYKLDPRAQSDPKGKISKWEKGDFPLEDVEKIEKIAKILECDPQYLLGYIEHPNITTSWIAEQIPLSGTTIELLKGLKKECDDRMNGDIFNDDTRMTRFLTDCVISHMVSEQADYGANETLLSLVFRLVNALKILSEYERVEQVGDRYVMSDSFLSMKELMELKRNPPERYRMAKWEKEMCEKHIGELFAENITGALETYRLFHNRCIFI